LNPEHIAQVLNYLKACNKIIGLLINFGNRSLQYKRVIL
ncbi:GxxExxY protein, partial [Candidatus Dojkabacteria bacterium]|nr:GxxExxY protein [Candidatus Dojkabacteria bacterium]